jgi:hypothetical protein
VGMHLHAHTHVHTSIIMEKPINKYTCIHTSAIQGMLYIYKYIPSWGFEPGLSSTDQLLGRIVTVGSRDHYERETHMHIHVLLACLSEMIVSYIHVYNA